MPTRSRSARGTTSDPRAAAVWRRPPGRLGAARPARRRRRAARGIAFPRYEAEYAYVATWPRSMVDPKTGAVRVTRVVVAHDCGLIINPDGLRSQIEGNVIQGVGRTLKEEVSYERDRSHQACGVHGQPLPHRAPSPRCRRSRSI